MELDQLELDQLLLDQLLLDQLELLQFELDQFELLQFELDQFELLQFELDQFELAQLELDWAALVQASESKTVPPELSVVRNCSSAAFGFGGSIPATAPAASISPVPSENGAAAVARELAISAPFTWSGVKPGCRARICAAAAATTGAENDVPDIQM